MYIWFLKTAFIPDFENRRFSRLSSSGNGGSNPVRTVLASLRAAGPGFEPGFRGPKPRVLPLDDPAIQLK